MSTPRPGFDPSTPSTVYAGLNGAQGGVFKSTTGGDSWSGASTGLSGTLCSSGCVLDLAVDPADPAVLYAAMPELASVYRTENGGGSWSTTATSLWAEKLVLDPLSPSTLFASGSVPGAGGIEKTTNGGVSWTVLSDRPGLPSSGISSHRAMALDPTTPETVWLVVEDVGAPLPLEAVYRSGDGGLFWQMTDDGLAGVQVRDLAFLDGWLLAATDDGVYRIFDGLFADGFESGDTSAW